MHEALKRRVDVSERCTEDSAGNFGESRLEGLGDGFPYSLLEPASLV